MRPKTTVVLAEEVKTSPFLSYLFDNLERQLKQSGSRITIYHTQTMRIAPCSGCYACQNKTPGHCRFKDDIEHIVYTVSQCKRLIVFSEIINGQFATAIKNTLDRCVSILHPTHGSHAHFSPEFIGIGMMDQADDKSADVFHRSLNRVALKLSGKHITSCIVSRSSVVEDAWNHILQTLQVFRDVTPWMS
jgi:hypothetical protein